MDVKIADSIYTLKVSRIELKLLARALDEHLLFEGDRFDLIGFSHDEAEAFADELASRTGIERMVARNASEDQSGSRAAARRGGASD